MVTKKRELSRDEIMRSLEALPDDATVEDFVNHLADMIGLETSDADGGVEPTITLPDRMRKRQLMESLNRLSDDATVDDVAYRLYVITKVERGRVASRAGKKVTQEEARERLKRWLQ